MAVSRKRKKKRRRGGGRGSPKRGGALSGMRGGFKGLARGVVGAGDPSGAKKRGGPFGWVLTALLLIAAAAVVYYRFFR